MIHIAISDTRPIFGQQAASVPVARRARRRVSEVCARVTCDLPRADGSLHCEQHAAPLTVTRELLFGADGRASAMCVDCGGPTSNKSRVVRCSACAMRWRRNGNRELALEHVGRQIATGKLTIRKMTEEERERWGPPKEDKSARGKRRRARSLSTPGMSEQEAELVETEDWEVA